MRRPKTQTGQPEGGIIQFAYTVDDIHKSMQEFTDQLGIGPWFLSGPFVPPEGVYRGKPTDMKISLAIAFSGGVTIELIQQHDDKPSVYQEFISKKGHGFHHWAILARDFEDEIKKYTDQGYEVVFSDRSPRGVRIVYVDTSASLPGMLEIIELNDALDDLYGEMYQISLDWDGQDLVRPAKSVSQKS